MRSNENTTETTSVANLWAESGARAGFTIHNELPHIGVSGDEGDGYIVPLPAPTWFSTITDEGTRDNVFRAMAAHALRVGQGKVKATKTPTREVAAEAVASALNGGYKPGRERDNDIADKEAARQFATVVRGKVAEVNPSASEKDILATIANHEASEAGKAMIAEFRNTVLTNGTYKVARKDGGGKAAVIPVTL